MFSLNTLNAQILSIGDIVIDAYFGTPKIYQLINRNDFGKHINSNIEGIDAIGLRAVYMLGSRIGLGLDRLI